MSQHNRLCFAFLLAAALLAPALLAQEAEEEPPIPALDSHEARASVRADGRALEYTVSARDYAIRNDEGLVTAHFSAFAYVIEGEDSARRPVTFAFNGGPGSSSIWLHLGLLGPRRVVVPSDAKNAGAPPYPLLENPHTLLTHTDLVFVDPVGTGFSHAVGESKDEDFWGVDEDVDSVARFVREWLTRNGRWASPKYVLGESYGGVRGALLGQALKQDSASVALNGLIFVSPAFDIQFVDGREDDLTYVTSLPTYAATALYHGALEGQVRDREAWLREVRAFATGPYLRALFAGQNLGTDERAGLSAELSRFTGLSADYWQRANLRVNASRFRKELLRERGLVLGRLDTRYRGSETDAVGESPESDPMMAGIGSAYVAAFQQYTRDELGLDWPERPYRFSGSGTFGKWKRSEEGQAAFSGWIDTVPALASSMQDNPALRVFVANGWFDVATTVLAAEYNLSRPGVDPGRVTLRNYDAGHMMYVHGPSLEGLARDLRAFYAGRAGSE
jgi:carboxypeptidase C (cathepsin A)